MDFVAGIINVRSTTDQWGPFAFDLAHALPAGDALTGASTVQSFMRDGGETTAHLIEPGSVAVAGSTISLRLQYPGATRLGLHELHFNAVLASGARHTLVFRVVLVD